jgi:hypothetical protein
VGYNVDEMNDWPVQRGLLPQYGRSTCVQGGRDAIQLCNVAGVQTVFYNIFDHLASTDESQSSILTYVHSDKHF